MFKYIVSFLIVFSISLFILPPFFILKEDSFDNQDNVQGIDDVNKIEIVEEEFEEISYGKPIYIEIPSVNISLEVKEGFYDKDNMYWDIETGYAFWANLSSVPSEKNGNTLIYAHNLWRDFYKLKNLKNGDSIYINTENGYRFEYVYIESIVVDPYDDSLFYWEDRNILTLLTCYGIGSTQRKLYINKYVNYEEL